MISEPEDAAGQPRRRHGEGGRALGSAERREAEEFGPGDAAAEVGHFQDEDGAGDGRTLKET